MREAFRPPLRDPAVRSLCETAHTIWSEQIKMGFPPMTNQQLIRALVENKIPGIDEISSRQWLHFQNYGTWAGHMDWDMLPSRTSLPVLHQGDKLVELWIKSDYLLNWFFHFSVKHNTTFVHDTKSFHNRLLWWGVERADQLLAKGKNPSVLVLSNTRKKTKKYTRILARKMRHMLEVRECRRRFNNYYGHELWTNEAVYLPFEIDGKERKEAKDVLRDIYDQVKENLDERFRVEPLLLPVGGACGIDNMSEKPPEKLYGWTLEKIEELG